MSPPGKDVLERLGAAGLARALDDLLDSAKLVKLANACALSYPGMRAQSQRRERLLADLVERAGKNAAARKAILRALRRETAAAARTWRGANDEERAALVAAALAGGGTPSVGAALVLAASDPGAGTSLEALLSRCEAPVVPAGSPPAAEGRSRPADGAAAREDRELARLRKRQGELLKKVRHLEAQLAKSRDGEKQLKRDLIERKGELAESRMRVERLRRELEAVRAGREGDDRKPSDAAAAAKTVESLSRTIRRLAAEQKKLAHAVGKAVEATVRDDDSEDPALLAVDEVRQALGELRKDRRQASRELATKLDDLATEVRAVRSAAVEPAGAPSPARRRRGADERVGVFVDVQNVYYGARQLKGKLDFDAMLQAATAGRRLVLARAYVVESKEIDQSGFIAMLQQRAIQVRRKTLRVRADGSMKGDWDMEMALDILDAAPGLDVVVLVSGDGDFTSLVTRVKAIGPRVEVVAFPRTTAKSLIEAADRFQPLDRKFMIRTERPAAAAAGNRTPEDAEGATIATGGGRAG